MSDLSHSKDYTEGSSTPATASTDAQLIAGYYGSSLPSMSNGQQVAFQMDQNGKLYVNPTGAATTLTNFHYDDMNVSTGGIARGTNFVVSTLTTLYSFTGAGSIYGMILNLGGLGGAQIYSIDLILDGNHIFGASGISTGDLLSNVVYDVGQVAADISGFLGWAFVDKSLRWSVPGGGQVSFNTSVQVKVTQTAGGAQKFNAGLIALTR